MRGPGALTIGPAVQQVAGVDDERPLDVGHGRPLSVRQKYVLVDEHNRAPTRINVRSSG